ncbi:unnamed protein product, partial [Mesorhabditis spiculigera]
MRFLLILMLLVAVFGLAYGDEEKLQSRRSGCIWDSDCAKTESCVRATYDGTDVWTRMCKARGRKRRDTVACAVDDDCDDAAAKCIKFANGDGGESPRCVVVV